MFIPVQVTAGFGIRCAGIGILVAAALCNGLSQVGALQWFENWVRLLHDGVCGVVNFVGATGSLQVLLAAAFCSFLEEEFASKSAAEAGIPGASGEQFTSVSVKNSKSARDLSASCERWRTLVDLPVATFVRGMCSRVFSTSLLQLFSQAAAAVKASFGFFEGQTPHYASAGRGFTTGGHG